MREPLGAVLIISEWNYPVPLSLAPLVGALAAGNCAVLKPSEPAPAASAELARLLPRYLDQDAVAVVEGAVINAHGKSLALYAFTADRRTGRRLLTETSSGAVGFGLPHAHLAVPGLPFGGVGESGLGRYHGRHSVETFSNVKAVLSKPLFPDTVRAVYPPFTTAKERLLRRIM